MPRNINTGGADSAAHQNAVLAALVPGACLDIDALVTATGLERKRVMRAAGTMVVRGLAERAAVGCYRLTPVGEAQKASGKPLTSGPRRIYAASRRRPASRRVKIWRAVRVKQHEVFTVPDLVRLIARDGDDPGKLALQVREYLSFLVRSGHVQRLTKRGRTDEGRARLHRFRLVLNTGPEAPMVLAGRKAIRDLNTGKVHTFQAGDAQ